MAESIFECTLKPSTPLISCIEVPGIIQGQGCSVLAALGGLKDLQQVLGKKRDFASLSVQGNILKSTSSDQVMLKLCTEDRFTKFLTSSVTPRSDVLLKIRRNRQSKEILSVNCIGWIIEKFSFENLADFYMVPPTQFRSNTINLEKELFEKSVEPLYIPPPIFTRIVSPLHLKSNARINEGLLHQTKRKMTSKSMNDLLLYTHDLSVEQSSTDITDFNMATDDVVSPEHSNKPCVSVLQESDEESKDTGSSRHFYNAVWKFEEDIPKQPVPNHELSEDVLEAISQYQKLFDERPMWLRTHLDYKVNLKCSQWKRKQSLACVCYYVSDGPWRGTLCRWNYNPKLDPDSLTFQTIDFRDPYYRAFETKSTPSHDQLRLSHLVQFRPASSALIVTSTLIDEIHFTAPPSRPSVLYQFCDIQDPAVQKLIQTSSRLDECSKITGWLPKHTLTRIRDVMLMAARNMRALQRFGNNDIQSD